MNATRARGRSKTVAPTPEKGVLIKEPAICSRCLAKCMIGGKEEMRDGYYTHYDEKLCRLCIRGII